MKKQPLVTIKPVHLIVLGGLIFLGQNALKSALHTSADLGALGAAIFVLGLVAYAFRRR